MTFLLIFLVAVCLLAATLAGLLVTVLGTLGARQQQTEADVRFALQVLHALVHAPAYSMPPRPTAERSPDAYDA